MWTVGGLEVKKGVRTTVKSTKSMKHSSFLYTAVEYFWISTTTLMYIRGEIVFQLFSFFLRWRTYICTLKCLACLTASSHRPWRASAWICDDSSVSRSHRCTVNHLFRSHILIQSSTDSQRRIYQAIFSKTFELT